MCVTVYSIDEVINDNLLCDAWHSMSIESKNLYSMYGSIEWIKSVDKHNPNIKIVIYKDSYGTIYNVIPIIDDISQLNILACELYGHIDVVKYVKILDGIFDKFKKAASVYIKSIDYNSDVFKTIYDVSLKSNNFFCHIVAGPRELHTVVFKDSFDDYLKIFSKKERYNLKRQCRLAVESVGGELKLIPVVAPEEIDFFVASAKEILLNSWKLQGEESEIIFSEKRCLEYLALAKIGLLRSYILVGQGEPWAFVLGYQWQGVFHYANIAYNINKSKYSPGIVLFYMMLEDLYKNNKPNVLNFGIGESPYKRRFGTDKFQDLTLLIVRNTFFNRIKYLIIDIFNKIKLQTKAIIRKKC